MKKWNTPVIAELDINMTEDGRPYNHDEGERWDETYGWGCGSVTVTWEAKAGDPQTKGRETTSNDGDVTNFTSGPAII